MTEAIQTFFEKRKAEANKRFAKLTKPQRAVMVAGDSIWQVTSGSVTPSNRHGYIERGFGARPHTCFVCGIGGLFAGIADHQRVRGCEGWFVRKPIADALKKHFTSGQLSSIESSFEGNWRANGAGRNPEAGEMEFFGRYKSSRDRFLRIAANIVHNEGKFIPTKDPSDAVFNKIIKKYGAKPVK